MTRFIIHLPHLPHLSNLSLSAGDSGFAKNDRVLVRVANNEWYAGTVARAGKKVVVHFDDGADASIDAEDFKHIKAAPKAKKRKAPLTNAEAKEILTAAKAVKPVAKKVAAKPAATKPTAAKPSGDNSTMVIGGENGFGIPGRFYEGFYRGGGNTTLPMPVARSKKWEGQDEFVKKLAAIKPKRHDRGVAKCRICRKPNGSGNCSKGKWAWPQGLLHTVKEHNVKPSQAFIDFIMGKK